MTVIDIFQKGLIGTVEFWKFGKDYSNAGGILSDFITLSDEIRCRLGNLFRE